MIKIITATLIGIAIGALVMFLFLSPKIIEFRAEVIRIEAFSECVNQKIIGQGEYEELYLIDVISCLKSLNNNLWLPSTKSKSA